MRTTTFLIITIVLAVGVSLVGVLTKIGAVQTVTLVLLSEVILGLVNINTLLHKAPPKLDVIEGETEIVNRARQMRDRAKRDMYCIWCSMNYGHELRKYFSEFKEMDSKVYRLINVKKEAEHILAHLKDFVQELTTGKYIVTTTSHSAFEFFVRDREEALILIPHVLKPEISLGIYSKDESFVSAIIQLYEHLAKEGNTLTISKQATEDKANEEINEWTDINAA